MTTNRATRESTRDVRSEIEAKIERVHVRERSVLQQRLAASWRVFANLANKHIAGAGSWRDRSEARRGEVLPYVDLLWVERCVVFLAKVSDDSDGFTHDELERWDRDAASALEGCVSMLQDLTILKSFLPSGSVERCEVQWLLDESAVAREVLEDVRIATAKALGRPVVSIG